MASQNLTGQQKSQISDFEVVRRVLAGEKELFEILMRRYNQVLYRTIRSYVNDEFLAEDLMQETYIKCYIKIEQYNGEAAFSTWLIRIGINEALQYLRKTKKKLLGNDALDPSKVIQLPDTHYMEPDKQYQKKELTLLLEGAVDQLPEKYKIVIVLHESEGMTNTEIAKTLELSEENVKVRLHRARNMLKNQLIKLSDATSLYEFGNSRCDKVVENVMKRL